VFADGPVPLRVLGVDPGLTRCGVGVIDAESGGRLRLVAVDVIRTPANESVDVRLLTLEREITAMVARWSPSAVAVERVFSQHNVRTVMGTAQAGAVAVLVAARHGLPVAWHTPSEVKAAVTGSGRADKVQIGLMVTRLLGLAAPPRPADAADALALAICYAWRAPAQARRAQANSAQKRPAEARATRGPPAQFPGRAAR